MPLLGMSCENGEFSARIIYPHAPLCSNLVGLSPPIHGPPGGGIEPLTAAPALCQESMLTGEIRNQVDQIWNAFWSGGVSNPLSVIEQITYLLFIKRLDDLDTLEESKAETLSIAMERRV